MRVFRFVAVLWFWFALTAVENGLAKRGLAASRLCLSLSALTPYKVHTNLLPIVLFSLAAHESVNLP